MGEWAVTASIPRSCCRRRGRASTKLKISDVTVREMLALRGRETHLPDKTALQVLDAVFRHLDFISRLQVDGAWSAILYAWPHLLPGETSYRTYFHPGLDRFMELTHGRNGTPGAGRLFLYAYQVLGDQRYLEVARKAGEWLLSAQQPEGYWVNHYDRHTGGRPTPRQEVLSSHRRTVHRNYPTFQDGRQSQAALFMARLYLVTLEERWLEAFRRSVDFILKAQNPNGSWGYYLQPEGRTQREPEPGPPRRRVRQRKPAHPAPGDAVGPSPDRLGQIPGRHRSQRRVASRGPVGVPRPTAGPWPTTGGTSRSGPASITLPHCPPVPVRAPAKTSFSCMTSQEIGSIWNRCPVTWSGKRAPSSR